MPRADGVPTVLIDGPVAGQFLYTDPDAYAWYVRPPIDPREWAAPLDLANWSMPEPVVYRFERRTACLNVRGSAVPAYVMLRIGWSEPGEPNEDAIRRQGRAALLDHPELLPPGAVLWPSDPRDDEPIRITEAGHGPTMRCADHMDYNRDGEIRGACPCGWRSEWVPRRRHGEVQALATGHVEAAIAWMYARSRIVARADFLEMAGLTGGTDGDDTLREVLAVLNPASRSAPEPAPEAWGERLTASDANWPAQGQTCAHVCGGDADHTCDAKASTRLTYTLPSGGTRSMPICQPCYQSETSTKETAHV